MNMEEFGTEDDLTSLGISDLDLGEDQEDEYIKIVEDFLLDLIEAESLYGTESVEAALEALLPGFDRANVASMVSEVTLLERVGGGKLVGKTFDYLKGIFTKSGRSARKQARQKRKADKAKAKGSGKGDGIGPGGTILGVGAADAASDLASTYISKNWDQEVDIARISTEDIMYVRNEKLEELIMQTNDAIEKMTQAMLDVQQSLGMKLDNIDTSVDDSIAAQTGETTGQVKSRQGSFGAMTTPPPKKKDKDKKDKPKPEASPAPTPDKDEDK